MVSWLIDKPQRITFDGPVNELDVHMINGRLNVVGTDGPARIEVARISRVPLLVNHRNGRITVRHRHIPRWPGLLWWLGQFGRRYRSEVSIAVPVGTSVNLNLTSGAVIVTGVRTATHVDVVSGHVTLMGLDGRTAAKVVSGSIEVLGAAGELVVETVSGELIVADSSARQVAATTVSGAITCDLDNPRDSEIWLGTTSGNITIRIREDSDVTARLQTVSGRITSGFPQLVPSVGPWLKTSRGVIGAGHGKLSASSTSGSIALLARAVDDESVDHVPADEAGDLA